MAAENRARGRLQLVARERLAGVEADEVDVGRQDVGAELPSEPEDAAVVLASELVEAGGVVVVEPFGDRVDHLGADRGLDVGLPVARSMPVGEVPGVDLDDQRPSLADLLEELERDRTVGLRLVRLDPEEEGEVLGERLEERPLVALEVDLQGHTERRQRLEARRVQELDPDVGAAVRLDVGTLGPVEEVVLVGRGLVAEQGHAVLAGASRSASPRPGRHYTSLAIRIRPAFVARMRSFATIS